MNTESETITDTIKFTDDLHSTPYDDVINEILMLNKGMHTHTQFSAASHRESSSTNTSRCSFLLLIVLGIMVLLTLTAFNLTTVPPGQTSNRTLIGVISCPSNAITGTLL